MTRKNQAILIENLTAIGNVIAFTDSQNRWKQIVCILISLPKIFSKRYEVVLDLQNHFVSRSIRRLISPKCFVNFEKFTPFTAVDRNWRALQTSGLVSDFKHPNLFLRKKDIGTSILKQNGWNKQKSLIILNPAGAFKSRNWPIENYAIFAKIWLKKYPNSQFIILGMEKIREKAVFLKRELKDDLINLVGATSLSEVFGIVSKARLALSEDSGLMHMAWALNIPTVALIGSTDKNRSSQNGEHIISLNSDDLPCGNCMKPDCQFGEVPFCLSRYSPQIIVNISEKLLSKK